MTAPADFGQAFHIHGWLQKLILRWIQRPLAEHANEPLLFRSYLIAAVQKVGSDAGINRL